MIVEGEYVFNGPQQAVYDMFNDPNALATAVPGMQKLEQVDETHYEGAIFLRIGPISAAFEGVLSLTDINPPESCTLNIEGKGKAGFAKGVGRVKFTDLGEVNIGGTLASVGQRMIDSVAKSLIKSGCEKLQKTLEERCRQK
jgi:carbon monoxide dehydrogenase subunit G